MSRYDIALNRKPPRPREPIPESPRHVPFGEFKQRATIKSDHEILMYSVVRDSDLQSITNANYSLETFLQIVEQRLMISVRQEMVARHWPPGIPIEIAKERNFDSATMTFRAYAIRDERIY